jgi:CBS domain-containing protein
MGLNFHGNFELIMKKKKQKKNNQYSLDWRKMAAIDEHHVGIRQDELDSVRGNELGSGGRGSEKGASIFLRTKASDLIIEKTMICVHADDSVGSAFKKLIENNILSVPVKSGKHFVAFVDILDIVAHFMETFDEFRAHPDWQKSNENVVEYLKLRGAFAMQTCGRVANKSGRNAFFAVESDAPLRAVVDCIVRKNVHRVPIVDGCGDLVTVVTQSRLVSWLDTNLAKAGRFPGKTIDELGMARRDVYRVKASVPVMDAFELIQDSQVSGVAVVDDSGRLIGNISVSDLKAIGYSAKMLDKLSLSAADFVAAVHSADQQNAADTSRIIPGPISVTPTTTLEETFKKFTVTRVHRVYVVEPADDNRLVGVISLGDLLSNIRSHLK